MGMAFPHPFVWRNDISTALGKKLWPRTSVNQWKYNFFPQKDVEMPHFCILIFNLKNKESISNPFFRTNEDLVWYARREYLNMNHFTVFNRANRQYNTYYLSPFIVLIIETITKYLYLCKLFTLLYPSAIINLGEKNLIIYIHWVQINLDKSTLSNVYSINLQSRQLWLRIVWHQRREFGQECNQILSYCST